MIKNMSEFVRNVVVKLEDEDGVWRTINGTPVFIKKGQSVEDAIKDRFSVRDKGSRKHRDIPEKDGGTLEKDRVKAVIEDTGFPEEKAYVVARSVRSFTGNDYKFVRKFQNTGEGDPWLAEMSESIESYIAAAPSYDGEIYRGLSSFHSPEKNVVIKVREQFLKVQPGDIIDMKGTSSWTSNKIIAENMGSSVLFVSDSVKKSTSIRHLSVIKVEDEVLVSKEAKFKVQSKAVIDGRVIIRVSEV